MTFLVKKIWSLNPSKYKCIGIKKAIKLYEEYISASILSSKRNGYELTIKSFQDWLLTEI